MTRKISAGPYALEIPPNGVAILYEVDEAGVEQRLAGGIGYLEALIQFAGEVIRLRSMVDTMRTDRNEQDVALRDAIAETARIATTIRAEALEEAARVCDSSLARASDAWLCATAIRALKDRP